jgi:hypothetical protein
MGLARNFRQQWPVQFHTKGARVTKVNERLHLWKWINRRLETPPQFPAVQRQLFDLSGFRRLGNGVFLGQNLTVRRPGRITVNDRVRIRGQISAVYA